MDRRIIWKLAMVAGSLGACVAAGTIRSAYPEWGNLQPLFSYIGGFMAAVAIFVDPPGYNSSDQKSANVSQPIT